MTVMRTRPIDVICYVPSSLDAVNVRTYRTAQDTLRDKESNVSAVVDEVRLNGVPYPSHPPTTRATTVPFRYGASMPRYLVLITHLHILMLPSTSQATLAALAGRVVLQVSTKVPNDQPL